jgi:hypothetical protein
MKDKKIIPDDYVPYGPEWTKEIMKLKKEVIVELLRQCLIDRGADIVVKK